ncbi:hypothetical protein L915_01873 [Phytophthora nicotianae]|uniref:Uncharacterized protein n=1 Tax=Phytophthora nicotianae TaxID=4792 RepID=W2HKR9_PHYNI|nr:hypothetical protein L915_01873 [Phytophthora nicotianae]
MKGEHRGRLRLTTYCITDIQDTFTDDSSTDKLIETTADMNLQVELAEDEQELPQVTCVGLYDKQGRCLFWTTSWRGLALRGAHEVGRQRELRLRYTRIRDHEQLRDLSKKILLAFGDTAAETRNKTFLSFQLMMIMNNVGRQRL